MFTFSGTTRAIEYYFLRSLLRIYAKTCAIKSKPKTNEEMILNIPSIDIFIKTVAAKSTLGQIDMIGY